MRCFIAVSISATLAATSAAQIVLPPAIQLRPGQQYRFYGKCPTGKTCQFVLANGHSQSSSITTDGLYTAPSTAIPRSKLGGCPVQPLSSVFNTKIDSLPLDPNSTAMVQQIVARAVGNYGTLHISPIGAAVNPVDESTQKVLLQSYYLNVGVGSWPLGTPPYLRVGSKDKPQALNQVGWRVLNIDNRVMQIDVDTCENHEFYFYGSIESMLENPKVSPITSKLSNINSYGVSNTFDWMNALGKPVGLNGSSNASGMWTAALQLDVDELMQSVDKDGTNANLGHVIGFTLPNTNIRPYSSKDYRWPAILWAGGYQDGLVPYGTRFRLKQSFIDAFPYAAACTAAGPATGIVIISQTRCQNAVRGIFNTIRDYGVILMDGTIPSDSGGLHTRSHGRYDPDWFAATYAFNQSKIKGWGNALASLEAVDESAFKVDSKSNLVRDPAAYPELVNYVDITSPAAPVILDQRDVIVYPPTLGALATQFNVIAGSGPLDLAAQNVWATGFKTNDSVIWSIVSGPGSVAAGKYVAPSSLNAPTSTIVRAAHKEDQGQFVDIRVVNYPPVGTGLCIRTAANQPGDVKDKLGRTCWSNDVGKVQVNPFATNLGGNLMQVVSKDPNFPNGSMWRSGVSTDQMARFQLPNGTYKVSALAVTPYGNPVTSFAPYDPTKPFGNNTTIDINGQLVYGPANVMMAIGAASTGNTFPVTVQVTNGTLVFGWRNEGNFGGAAPTLAGLLIESTGTAQRRVPVGYIVVIVLLGLAGLGYWLSRKRVTNAS